MLSPSESVDVFIRRALAHTAADSDDEMVKSLLADSIDSETAECLVAFVPMAFAHVILGAVGVRLPDSFLVNDLSAGRYAHGKLLDEPIFVAAHERARSMALEIEKMARVNPTVSQKDRLLKANASRCCICKRRSIGFHFHHIDENSSNTIDENLAVLCVEDHDRHHRMREYESRARHLEFDAREILRLKNSWETFVTEANRPEPTIIATLSAYGTEELIHSLQLVMQWPVERIECTRSFHLLDGDLDRLTDEVFEEVAAIGTKVKLVLIDEPLPVEHCASCRIAFSRTLKPPVVTRLTDPAWATESACGIYINPDQPSLVITLSFKGKQILSGSLHLCQQRFLDYSSEGVDERTPIRSKPSVRAQAARIVNQILGQVANGQTPNKGARAVVIPR